MTRFHVFKIAALCVWVLCMIPAQGLAEPPASAYGDSNSAATDGDASPHGFQDPLDRKISRVSSAETASFTKQDPRRAKTGGSMVQAAIGLAFVLCLILIVAAWAKRHLPQANNALPSEAVQILGQRPIGQRQMIQLIRCGSRILILGSTPDGLTTLSEVTDPVEVDYLAGLCRQDQPNSVTSAFSRLFQNYREMGGESASSANPLRSLSAKLRRSDTAVDATTGPPHRSTNETSAETPERSLKERLGRLGHAGDESRFSPPGAEGSYE